MSRSAFHRRSSLVTSCTFALVASCGGGGAIEPDAGTDAVSIDSANLDVDAATDAMPDAPTPPGIADISVAGAGTSNQARQGAGTIRLAISGTGLVGATTVNVGEWTATIVAGGSDQQLLAEVSIPHGVSLGFRTVTVTTPGGTDALANAVAITEITSSPSGSDTGGLGTPDAPFATATRALSVAGSQFGQPADTVRLMAGAYGSLETWPLRPAPGVIVRGDATGSTILQGSGMGQSSGQIALMADQSTIQDLSVQDFFICTVSYGASFARVHFERCTSAMQMSGASLVEDVSIVESWTGLEWRSDTNGAQVVVRRLTVIAPSNDAQGWAGIRLTGGSGTGALGSVVVQDSRVEDIGGWNQGTGIMAWPTNGNNFSLRVRGTTVVAQSGVQLLGEPAEIDFGQASSNGNNTIRCSATGSCVADQRPARAVADGVVWTHV